MADIIFPASHAPGQRAGEGEGRLINAHVIKEGDNLYWRRAPGLSTDALVSQTTPRSLFEFDGGLLIAYLDCVVYRAPGGSASTLTGGIASGTWYQPATFARNIKQPTADIVMALSTGGAYVIDVGAGTVNAHPDTDLPTTVNSVDSLSGFHLYTNPVDSKIYASDLNTTAQNALSYATAEARPDDLLRGMTFGDTYLAFGKGSIEPWKNNGGSPFPLVRHTTVIPVGLLNYGAVAGGQQGWDRNIFFVAHDGTVRELRGYNPVRVSTPAVERFIANSNFGTLTAYVYTCPAGAFWVLNSNVGTWEYNTTTQSWSQRQSATGTGWRARHSAKVGNTWFLGDTLSSYLLWIDPDAAKETAASLTFEVESAGLKEYPARYTIPSLFLDLTLGVGDGTTPNPVGEFAHSRDGGQTWSAWRSFSLGAAGASVGPVRFNGLGMASHNGLRVKVRVSDPVGFSLIGAHANITERKP